MATPRTATTKWKATRLQAIRRAKKQGQAQCLICGVELDYHQHGQPNSAEADHITPHSLGGSDDIENVQIICRKDNQKLGGKVGSLKRNANRSRREQRRTVTKTLETAGQW